MKSSGIDPDKQNKTLIWKYKTVLKRDPKLS